MSSKHNPDKSAKPPLRKRVLYILITVILTILLIIAIAYAALQNFVTEPDVKNVQAALPSNVIVRPIIPSEEPQFTGAPDVQPSEEPDELPSEQPSEPQPEPLVLHRKEGVYTCLLAGTDDGNGCTDTIMLGVFNTVDKTAALISIPRDTLANIKGKDGKINTAYAKGGMNLLCETVANMLAIPVDFYVAVDLEAFKKIVDETGGVWFDVPQDMDYDDPNQNLSIHIKAGYQLLDGESALGVMRFRRGYSNQDIGRVQTQRNFLIAMVKQTISLSNVSKVTALVEILNEHVNSNMSLNNMVYFATQAIGMDLNTALLSATLPSDWIYPVLELRDDEVLEIINDLNIYEEEIPAGVMNIRHNKEESSEKK